MQGLPELQASNREAILAFERALLELPQEQFKTTHYYAREIVIPKGAMLTGKIHRHAHYNVVSKGHILVATEHGMREIVGPCAFMAPAGTKRAGYALEETHWMTLHPIDEKLLDLLAIEEFVIAPSFEALEAPVEA